MGGGRNQWIHDNFLEFLWRNFSFFKVINDLKSLISSNLRKLEDYCYFFKVKRASNWACFSKCLY